MNDTAEMTMRISGIDPSTLEELHQRMSNLEEFATIEPDDNSVTEDRERHC
jgi:hypothetical protein